MDKFQTLYEQLATNVIDPSKLTKKSTDKEMLRLAIQAEYDAVNLYEQMSETTSNSKIRKIMLDVAREEKVHIGEFEELLRQVDDEQERALSDGAEEVGQMLTPIRCQYCGKLKQWVNKPPKWYYKKIRNPFIIGDYPADKNYTGAFCSKKCLKAYK